MNIGVIIYAKKNITPDIIPVSNRIVPKSIMDNLSNF